MAASARRRLIRVDEQGNVALPTDLRAKLGLKQGDLVSVTETAGGLLISSQAQVAADDIERVEAELAEQGLSLDDLIESGREIRAGLIEEQYGLGD